MNGNCHLLIPGNKHKHFLVKIGNDLIWESNDVRLLGITIDSDLEFERHLTKKCKKAYRKISALSKLVKYLKWHASLNTNPFECFTADTQLK